jgi:hypothetical protein
MTSGARGPHGRLGWPGRLGNAQHDRLPVIGEGRPGTALRREKRRGKGGGRTGSSPGIRRGGQLGRRMAGGEQFGRRSSDYCEENPVNRRRFWAPRLDSSGEEEEGGVGDLLSTSAGLGRARDGGARWQPWRCLQATGRKHGEEGGRQGKKKGGEGVSRGVARGSPGILLVARKQEVASGCPGSSTQVLLCPNEEDKVSFALSPLALGSFPENFKTELVCIIW